MRDIHLFQNRRILKFLVLLIGLNFVICGCETYPTRIDQQHELQAQLQKLVVEDGIDLQEANIIAQSYFLKFGPGCGAAADVTDDGSFWVAKTYVGFAAVPSEPIRIDKRTGRVTCGKWPTVENPKTIFN